MENVLEMVCRIPVFIYFPADFFQANEDRRDGGAEATQEADIRVHEEVPRDIQQASMSHRIHRPIRLREQRASIRNGLDEPIQIPVSQD